MEVEVGVEREGSTWIFVQGRKYIVTPRTIDLPHTCTRTPTPGQCSQSFAPSLKTSAVEDIPPVDLQLRSQYIVMWPFNQVVACSSNLCNRF